MPAALATKEEVLARLLETFRRDGYDGASLAELSKVTGLGKSSLYHHFPRGKAQMATDVLAFLDERLEADLFAPLTSGATPARKLDAMLDTIDAFYDGGKKACLLERLCASTDHARFRRPLARAFTKWMSAIESLAIEAGVSPAIARARAEDAVVRISGALIVSAGTGETGPFRRALDGIRKTLLAKAS
jgi:TetR/AcrR family transcriptional regulator, lmrAB and yxaGH operons repressor